MYKSIYTARTKWHQKASMGVKGLKQKRSTEGCSKLKKSENKTSLGEIGLDMRTHASPKVGQDQVSGGVSVLCWHATPVVNILWKPRTIR